MGYHHHNNNHHRRHNNNHNSHNNHNNNRTSLCRNLSPSLLSFPDPPSPPIPRGCTHQPPPQQQQQQKRHLCVGLCPPIYSALPISTPPITRACTHVNIFSIDKSSVLASNNIIIINNHINHHHHHNNNNSNDLCVGRSPPSLHSFPIPTQPIQRVRAYPGGDFLNRQVECVGQVFLVRGRWVGMVRMGSQPGRGEPVHMLHGRGAHKKPQRNNTHKHKHLKTKDSRALN
jgi:hypothetical protein